jgi:Zn-dependent peptidase ImmA (M78 family)
MNFFASNFIMDQNSLNEDMEVEKDSEDYDDLDAGAFHLLATTGARS